MNRKHLLLFLLAACIAPALARDTVRHLEVAPALAAARAEGIIDGSVAFYFEGQHTPAVIEDLGLMTVNRKTNGATKSDDKSCQWALFGALRAMQASALKRGANAVVGLRSNYDKIEWVSATEYECHAGGLMSGVALKGRYARIAAPR
jgi:uncharacterized protein YbjQ (UPF0145 family)